MKNLITYLSIIIFAIALSPQKYYACSTVIAIDISTSMQETMDDGMKKIDLAKTIAKRWIEASDMTNTEVAIVSFCSDAIPNPNDPNEPVSEYSQNKDDLFYAVDNISNLCAGTNYNAAFLNKRSEPWVENLSALYYCKPDVAQFKPVIFFITDGNHLDKWGGVFDLQKVKLLANQRNASIYVVKIGKEELTPENLNNIKELALIGKDPDDTSPNYWLDVENADELSDVYGCQEFVGVSETIAGSNSSVMVYPNPSIDELTVSLSDFVVNSEQLSGQKLNISIYDFMGKKVRSYDFKQITNNYNFDISELENGSYFVKCSGRFVNQLVPFIVLK